METPKEKINTLDEISTVNMINTTVSHDYLRILQLNETFIKLNYC